MAASPRRLQSFCSHSSNSSRSSCAQRRLTPRSSGAPTAGHQARPGGTRYIFTSPGLAPRRCRRLSSNVRPHVTPTQDLQREVKSASPWLTERVGYGGTPAARFDYLKTLAALPLATATPIAHAHGEEVLVSLGLVLLSFLACVLAIRVVKPLRPDAIERLAVSTRLPAVCFVES